MKFAIATAVQGRYQLFKAFCEYYAEMKTKFDFELYISVSEEENKVTARNCGHKTVDIPNQPLWKKVNASAQIAKDYKYIIFIGSDDFLSPETLAYYVGLFSQNKWDYIYPLDWYFFDAKTKKGLYWAGYDKPFNKGIACGAGRALSYRAMSRLNFKPWIEGFDSVLDTGFDKQIRKLRLVGFGFKLKDMNLFALDVKTKNNMTKFAVWDNSFPLDGRRMLQQYMPNHFKKIYNQCAV